MLGSSDQVNSLLQFKNGPGLTTLDPVHEMPMIEGLASEHSRKDSMFQGSEIDRKVSEAFITVDDEYRMSLLEKSEKIPIATQETVIVLSSTVREQNLRRKRWIALKVSVVALFVAWLLWALFFTPGAAV